MDCTAMASTTFTESSFEVYLCITAVVLNSRTLQYLFGCLQQNVKDKWTDNQTVQTRVVRYENTCLSCPARTLVFSKSIRQGIFMAVPSHINTSRISHTLFFSVNWYTFSFLLTRGKKINKS